MSTLTDTLKKLYLRDLNKLIQELSLYQREENIWRTAGDVSNAAGNLCLHLIGNLNTYIGAELGGSGYVRDRPAEFSLKNIPRKELVNRIESTMDTLANVLDSLTEEEMESEYPQLVSDHTVSTSYFLVHLATHLSYHLGQINYHRRMIDLPSIK